MLENIEVWKDLKGYPGYQVSSAGRIWSQKSQRNLKPSQKPNGYLQINLIAANGKRKKEYVHRLVALAFIPNPNGLPEVDHINRNRADNSISNLRWIDRKGNCANSSQLKRINVLKNGELVGSYSSIKQACEELGLTPSNVSACLSDKCSQKTHLGYTFTIQEVI